MSADRLEWLKNNPAACYNAFSNIYLRSAAHNDIEFSCCCNLASNNITASNRKVFFDRLQTNIQQGRKTPECHRCYRDEEKGWISERMRNLLSIDDSLFEKFQKEFKTGWYEVNVKFTNLCPLSCRSCSPGDSSTYAKITKEPVSEHEISDLSNNNDHWKIIQEEIARALHHERPALHLIGGETLVQDGVFKMLRWMKDTGYDKMFSLRLTTSLAVNLNDELMDLLYRYHDVCFNLSIDSVSDNYHYVRWPARFEKISRNLDYLIANRKNFQCDPLMFLAPVFSINNCFYINEYLDFFDHWMDTNDIVVEIRNTNLQYPVHLSIENLSFLYKDQLVEVIDRAQQHPIFKKTNQSTFLAWLNSAKQSCCTADNESNFVYFLKFTADFDKRTNTRFENLNKKLWDILSEDHKKIYNSHYAKCDIQLPLLKSINRK